MLPFVLMAQLNTEKSSQGCFSLQYFESVVNIDLAMRLIFPQLDSNRWL